MEDVQPDSQSSVCWKSDVTEEPLSHRSCSFLALSALLALAVSAAAFPPYCPLQYYQIIGFVRLFFFLLLHCSHCGTITPVAALMGIDAAEGLAHTNIHKKFMILAQ